MRWHCKHFKIGILLSIIPILFGVSSAYGQVTVKLSPVARQQFFDANGVPLASGCLYTYAAGTTTFLASYSDSTGNTQNADPIQLDTGGFANIWLTGSAYKFAVYKNPGGACPGSPGGSLVLQYTVDNITTSTGSGAGAATSVVSAGANPASSGIIEMTKSDTICWRNVGNSANVCASLDSANNLTWSGGSLALTEIAAPSGVGGEDILWADSTAHRLQQSDNGGAAKQLVNAGADINTSDQVTVTHLAAALPVAQGGTGATAATGSGNVVLATSPTITTPTVTTPTINTGVANNGTGFQHLRFTSCNPGGGTFQCTSTASWHSSFADTNYTMTCTGARDANNNVSAVSWFTKTTSGFSYVFQDLVTTNENGTVEIDCIGIHD